MFMMCACKLTVSANFTVLVAAGKLSPFWKSLGALFKKEQDFAADPDRSLVEVC